MKPVVLGITTFVKNPALSAMLESLIKHGYTEGNTVLIADDGAGHARPVFEEFKSKIKSLVYITGKNPQYGISVNKNRCIDYLLQNKKDFDAIFLFDDDFEFIRPGFIEHCYKASEEAKIPFLSGFWYDWSGVSNDDVLQTSGRTWTDDFPVKGSTELVNFHTGKHGHCLYVKTEAVEKVGYYNVLSSKYGGEHSLYFSRLLLTHCLNPEFFPIIKHCNYWYKGQNIKNEYVVTQKMLDMNMADHKRLLPEVYRGHGLYIGTKGIKQKEKYTT
jgi:glycosyltransferase involved in cell wall biosynthesis